ncbi:Tubulin alpha-1 chain, partial [Durusdinium trenchii]
EVVDVDKFREWFEQMKKNDAELRSFLTMDTSVKQAGDGCSVLFDKLPSAGGPKVLPKVKVGGSTSSGAPMDGPTKANPMPSVVSINLGAESCAAAKTIWQRYLSEHQLDASARPKDGQFYGCSNTLFASSTTGRYIPRSILASYDSATMDALGEAGLFNPATILTGNKPGPSHQSGESDGAFMDEEEDDIIDDIEAEDEIMDCVRRQLEEADYVEGFMFLHNAAEDACTNGVTSSLLQKLCVEYGKKSKFTFTGMADQGGDASQHAMSGLMMSTLSEYSDLTTFYDRSSLKKVAASKVNGLGISSPDDLTLNGLLARLLSGVTGPMRFGKAMNCNQGFRAASILTLQTNLCCYPRIKYLVPSIGGLVAKGMEDFAVGKANQEVGADACGHALKRGLLCGINPSEGKIIAYSMMCRGVELGSAISKVADLKTDRNYQ